MTYSKRSQELAQELEARATQNLRDSAEKRRRAYWRREKRKDTLAHVWLWASILGGFALYVWAWANYWR